MVATAAAYHWSSHLDYLAQRTQSWVSTDFALRLFHTDREAAIAAYRRFMDEGLDESSDFEAAILDERRSVQFPATPPIDSCQLKSRKSLAELIDEACQKFGVTPQVLASTCRHRAVTHVRAWIAHRAIMLGVASLSRVARAFDRSEASLRESVKHHFNFP